MHTDYGKQMVICIMYRKFAIDGRRGAGGGEGPRNQEGRDIRRLRQARPDSVDHPLSAAAEYADVAGGHALLALLPGGRLVQRGKRSFPMLYKSFFLALFGNSQFIANTSWRRYSGTRMKR